LSTLQFFLNLPVFPRSGIEHPEYFYRMECNPDSPSEQRPECPFEIAIPEVQKQEKNVDNRIAGQVPVKSLKLFHTSFGGFEFFFRIILNGFHSGYFFC